MAHHGLQGFRERLVEAYLSDLVELEEFVLLYQNNLSRLVFPHWKFEKFDLESWDEAECHTELRFRKSDLPALLVCLSNPRKDCVQSEDDMQWNRSTVHSFEKTCIPLSLYRHGL